MKLVSFIDDEGNKVAVNPALVEGVMERDGKVSIHMASGNTVPLEKGSTQFAVIEKLML
jgi:hypothetical protein